MSVIRATVVLSTTKNHIELTKNIRDLHCYCQKQHTAVDPKHRCSVELAKGLLVPTLDIPDKVLSHLSNAQQAHFEPLRKTRDEINTVYNNFTGTGMQGTMALKLTNDLRKWIGRE